ncbi:MAG: hypothetical protein ACP5GE_02725 [Thermoplasmata archaeon]|jgi:tRNA splicing endonuclease
MRFNLKNGRIFFRDRSLRNSLINEGYSVTGKKDFYLDPLEALYLVRERGAVLVYEGTELPSSELERILGVDRRKYAVYRDLRKRGYSIGPDLYLRRENVAVKIFSPRDKLDNVKLSDFLAAIVDDDLDCTYFMVKCVDVSGEFNGFDDYFGEGVGEFSDQEKKNLHDDLVKRGCRVKSGLKFGTEFIAYVKRDEVHSRYMVKILRSGMEWIEIAGLARVAHGVKKVLLLALPGPDFLYFSITWFRP